MTKKRISKYDVLDLVHDNKYAKLGFLANALSVTKPTIRKRLHELWEDGIKILPTPQGYRIFDGIDKESDALQIRDLGKWLAASIMTIGAIGKVAHKPMIEAKKYLNDKLDSDERRELRKICVFTTKLIDYIEIENEM